MKKDRIITLRLDEATYQRLKSLADRSGATLSHTIRRHLEAPNNYTHTSPTIHFVGIPTPPTSTWPVNTTWRAA